MTDEQIIKALECCVNADCENCPSKTICDSDTERFVVKVSDLINRQKAEIDRLENSLAISKKETKRYVENYKRQKEEIEEYRNIIERATEGIREVKAMLPRELAKERAKAVKEFCKRRGIEYVEDDV